MRPADLFLYLLGNRGSIERIAASKGAVWIGAILVLTAGIARNYDHLDLLREPEWFLAPFLVSLLSATVIFLCVSSRLDLYWTHGRRHHFSPFLALFWLTAPCAWLYAIPVEGFTDLLTATKFNVALLAVVSLWRVALIARAVRVLTGGSRGAILLAVLVPACAEAWFGSILGGRALVGIMGGVRLPPHHEFLHAASRVVLSGSFWLGLVLLPFFLFTPRHLTRTPRGLTAPHAKLGGPVWVTSLIVLFLWVAIALPLQPRMQRRHHLQDLLHKGRFEDAIRYAAAHGPDRFSSWHYLPPDPFGRGHDYPALLEKMDGSEPEWLRKTWFTQGLEALKMALEWGPRSYQPYLVSYRRLPGGAEFLLAHEPELRRLVALEPWQGRGGGTLKEFDEAMAELRSIPLPPSTPPLTPDRPSSPLPQ